MCLKSSEDPMYCPNPTLIGYGHCICIVSYYPKRAQINKICSVIIEPCIILNSNFSEFEPQYFVDYHLTKEVCNIQHMSTCNIIIRLHKGKGTENREHNTGHMLPTFHNVVYKMPLRSLQSRSFCIRGHPWMHVPPHF